MTQSSVSHLAPGLGAREELHLMGGRVVSST